MAKDLHVAILPWSAFGHIMPFLQLSTGLAKSGVRVSFISTPTIIRRLPELPSESKSLLRFVPIPLPARDGDGNILPEAAEATVDISFDKIPYLKIAYDLLQHPIRKFVADESPDWLIVDFGAPWAADIAREFGVSFMVYSCFSVTSMAFLGPPEYLVGAGRERLRSTPESLTSPPEWFPFPSSVCYRRFDAPSVLSEFYGKNASGWTDAERVAKVLSESRAIAVRTCPEIEPEYLNLYKELLGKPVIPVGLIPPEKPEKIDVAALDPSWADTFKWLNGQILSSVVFVGFGSECKLSKDQIYEIAHGLELSDLPFLWVLRKPDWAIEDSDATPPGFAERTGGRGRICLGWAPQREIPAHPSVGGSLFHSGWGSIIETLQHGHSLVVLPFIVDQGLNARMLVEKGMAVEVERNEDDGSFKKEDVAKCLRMAMVSEEGAVLRKRAREAAAVVGDQALQRRYVEEFVGYLVENGRRKGL